ncbi:MAG TPA: plasmid pRiA4b ORF-3 family protein [Rhodocyclaceae bacterium]|nr:plasmid pRiA4b ORF-3 family protein [Rhodocyclaceae bacterium]
MTDKPATKAGPRTAAKAKKPGAATATVHQFKITLDSSKPPIWRRIQLPSDASFWDLHCAVNDAMGWEDAHLHAFQIGGPPNAVDIGIPDENAMPWGEVTTLAGWEVPIATHFKQVGDRCTYLYDFGDDWSHDVVLEEILPRAAGGKYPRCLAGARACPPEDCGGIYGYTQLCKALTKPGKADENIEELLEWIGPDFDPKAFDAGEVTFYSAKRRLKALRESMR